MMMNRRRLRTLPCGISAVILRLMLGRERIRPSLRYFSFEEKKWIHSSGLPLTPSLESWSMIPFLQSHVKGFCQVQDSKSHPLLVWWGYILRQSDDMVHKASAFSETREEVREMGRQLLMRAKWGDLWDINPLMVLQRVARPVEPLHWHRVSASTLFWHSCWSTGHDPWPSDIHQNSTRIGVAGRKPPFYCSLWPPLCSRCSSMEREVFCDAPWKSESYLWPLRRWDRWWAARCPPDFPMVVPGRWW